MTGLTSSGQPRGRRRTRRSHALGGCKTCRRRHVKCDQGRPACQKCLTLGATCEGFSEELRWMPTTKRHRRLSQTVEEKDSTTRHHLYTEQSRASMTTSLSADLVSGSIDASLEEIEARLSNPDHHLPNDVRIGPFAVLNFSTDLPGTGNTQINSVENAKKLPDGANTSTSNIIPEASPFSSVIDPLASNVDDLLQWSDLFAFNSDFTGIATEPFLDMTDCFHSDSYPALPISDEVSVYDPALVEDKGEKTTRHSDCDQHGNPIPNNHNHTHTDISPPIDVLADASLLLKNFQENVIPQMTLIPLGKTTPWGMVSVPAAIMTLGSLKILETQDIREARLANLYVLLACSATHLASDPYIALTAPSEHWKQVADQAYHQAKEHMQTSLREETNGPNRAKFKDQLMAICAMTEFTIFSGLHHDARRYVLDAERLLCLRGMAKCRTSQKARLLLNMYTWLRIMGESTYVLHEYSPSGSFMEALNSHFLPGNSDESISALASAPRADGNHRLDDFLHLKPRYSDSDLDIDEPKDREKDITDIHLQDSRKSSETLGKQVYGVPETWLSLVSQTTRLANVMETLRVAKNTDWKIDQRIWDVLNQRGIRLENVINAFNLKTIAGKPDHSGESAILYEQMLRALNAALVILFYRRIRHVHAAILEGQVEKVIIALQSFHAGLSPNDSAGPATLWPAFMAGCEAISATQRQALLELVEKGEKRSGLAPFTTAKDVMVELWRRQDNHLAQNRGASLPDWIDIVRERQIWPTFC